MVEGERPDLEGALTDPTASNALKGVLRQWVARDPVDAVNDAVVLLGLLWARLEQTLGSAT